MEIANVEMFEAWDGQEGDDWTDNAARFERSGWRHRPLLVNPSIVGAGDRVLDIGCGTGRSAIEAARLAATGSVLGIDLSSRMLAYAREQAAAEGVTNVSFVQGDAQVQPSSRTRPTSRSATAAPCSSATRSPPSPTSPVPCGRAVGSLCSPGASSSATSGSPRSAAPWRSGASWARHRRTRRPPSRSPIRTG